MPHYKLLISRQPGDIRNFIFSLLETEVRSFSKIHFYVPLSLFSFHLLFLCFLSFFLWDSMHSLSTFLLFFALYFFHRRLAVRSRIEYCTVSILVLELFTIAFEIHMHSQCSRLKHNF